MEVNEPYLKASDVLNTTEQDKSETKYLDKDGNQVSADKAFKKIVKFFDFEHHVIRASLFIRFSTDSPW